MLQIEILMDCYTTNVRLHTRISVLHIHRPMRKLLPDKLPLPVIPIPLRSLFSNLKGVLNRVLPYSRFMCFMECSIRIVLISMSEHTKSTTRSSPQFPPLHTFSSVFYLTQIKNADLVPNPSEPIDGKSCFAPP